MGSGPGCGSRRPRPPEGSSKRAVIELSDDYQIIAKITMATNYHNSCILFNITSKCIVLKLVDPFVEILEIGDFIGDRKQSWSYARADAFTKRLRAPNHVHRHQRPDLCRVYDRSSLMRMKSNIKMIHACSDFELEVTYVSHAYITPWLGRQTLVCTVVLQLCDLRRVMSSVTKLENLNLL
jgi:hypothetical protein